MKGLTLLLMVALIFGGTYWYNVAKAVCPVPISYRIGSIDPRFNISYEEVRNAVSSAESMWEDATGKNLFMFDEGAEVSINFIYDERQAQTNEEERLREVLTETKDMNESIKTQYEKLLSNYQSLKKQFETRTEAYESKLDAYNREVADWNEQGGAPKDVYERLTRTQTELAQEQEILIGLTGKLNTLAKQMNTLSARGNSIITDYNETVDEYNSKFTESHEFTQGDYENRVINIYQFGTREELELVLAHEFGHALSLEHVTGETSIMYHLMGMQSLETKVTGDDLGEFTRVCGDGSISSRMAGVIRERVLGED